MREGASPIYSSLSLVSGIALAVVAAALVIGGCKQNKAPMDRYVASRHLASPAPELQQPVVPQAVVPQAVVREPPSMDDEELVRAIERKISLDSARDMSEINVNATKGMVALSGTVDNILARERATRIAESVKGVRAVSNRVEVTPPATRTDEEIRRDVQDLLLWDPAADSLALEVSVTEGKVSLEGSVQSFAEKQLAERVAKGVNGIVDMENSIALVYPAERSDGEIARDIEQRLRWDALIDSALIDVKVHQGSVELSGVVGSAAEKSRAHQDAWVMGVTAVDHANLDVQWWTEGEERRGARYAAQSDEDIARAVKDAARFEPRVRPFDITAEVSRGVVTLRGVVDNLAARQAAEKLAESIAGAAGVRNLIAVRVQTPVASGDIAQRVRSALAIHPSTHRYEINVRVSKGKVLLRGEVDTFFEKAEAENLAMSVAGVSKVVSELEVFNLRSAYAYNPYVYPYHPLTVTPTLAPPAPARSDAEILQDIVDDMLWSPFVDAGDIEVSVDNGRATLTGAVDTWRARAAATGSALEGGAIAVDNRLTVRSAARGEDEE
jgi:osmotically-inducible protein OsmY